MGKINIRECYYKYLYDGFLGDDSDIEIKNFEMLKNSIVNENYYIYYDKIISNTVKLLNELNIDDSISTYDTFLYLFCNGYFSLNKNLVFKSIYVKNLIVPGAETMLGHANCLSSNDMLTSVFKKQEKGAYTFSGKLLNSAVNAYYSMPINYNYIENKEDIKGINNIKDLKKTIENRIYDKYVKSVKDIIGNHAISVVKDNDDIFGFDVTSFTILRKNKKNYFEGVNSDEKFINKMYLLLIRDNLSFNEIMNLFNSETKYDFSNIKETEYNILDKCNNNINLFDDFYYDNYKNIKGVVKTLKNDGSNFVR